MADDAGAIVVTGAGQIGCLTAALARRAGKRVVLVDVRAPSPEVRAFCGIDDVPYRACDVTDAAGLEHVVREAGADRIVHTAALLSTAIRQDPVAGVRVNAVGSAVVLELARKLGLARVVLASSTTVTYPVFGSFAGASIPEDFAMRTLSEAPGSIYSATKLFTEHLVLLYRRLYGVDAVALRYAAVIGAWPGPVTSVPGRLLDALVAPALAGRIAVIDDPLLVWEGPEEFVDARDCAAANLAALDAVRPAQGVYHVAAGGTVTHDGLVAEVQSLVPGARVETPVAPRGGFAGFPHERPAPSDLRAAALDLGFKPRWSMRDTLAGLVGWQRDRAVPPLD